MTEPMLLQVSEVGTALGLGRRKVYELLDTGTIKSVKIGRARRVPRAELERYVAELMNTEPANER